MAGTREGEESYKAGTKMTNIVLEILNLQKKEDVTVDLVSNQDFTEVGWIGGSECEVWGSGMTARVELCLVFGVRFLEQRYRHHCRWPDARSSVVLSGMAV